MHNLHKNLSTGPAWSNEAVFNVTGEKKWMRICVKLWRAYIALMHHHVTAMAVNFRYPSTTALWTATRSAHTVKPNDAFSTLQPVYTQSLIKSI